MNKREKLLAGMVGVMFVLLVAFYSGKSILDRFTLARTQATSVSKQKFKQDLEIRAGKLANEKLVVWEKRALPWDADKARNLYKSWLLDVIDRCELESPNVNAVAGRANRDVYYVHTFNMTCRGDIRKLTRFLYEFYSVDYLHRFKSMSVKPIRERKDLTLTFIIEAMAAPGAPDRDVLESGPTRRLAHKDLETYVDAIVQRNMFSPLNNPPELSVQESYEIALDESLQIEPRASDPDKKDLLSFHADLEEFPDARLDQRSGKLSWRPREMGEYLMTLYVSDDNLPSKTAKREIRVRVVEPRPKPDPEPPAPKPPGFDISKFAFLTGITTAQGKPQIWLSLRTEGKVLKLGEGDDYSVGRSEGKVIRIDQRTVELEGKDGRRLQLSLGKNLAEAAEPPSGE